MKSAMCVNLNQVQKWPDLSSVSIYPTSNQLYNFLDKASIYLDQAVPLDSFENDHFTEQNLSPPLSLSSKRYCRYSEQHTEQGKNEHGLGTIETKEAEIADAFDAVAKQLRHCTLESLSTVNSSFDSQFKTLVEVVIEASKYFVLRDTKITASVYRSCCDSIPLLLTYITKLRQFSFSSQNIFAGNPDATNLHPEKSDVHSINYRRHRSQRLRLQEEVLRLTNHAVDTVIKFEIEFVADPVSDELSNVRTIYFDTDKLASSILNWLTSMFSTGSSRG